MDEATKKADVQVVYAKSFYGGAANANTKLAGEIIGILAGPNPAEVKSGLEAAVDVIENQAHFVSANDDDTICYYAHCISRTGSYLSEGAGIKEGEAIAYLIAPPLEAMYGVDAALKAADVKTAAHSRAAEAGDAAAHAATIGHALHHLCGMPCRRPRWHRNTPAPPPCGARYEIRR